MAGRIPQHFIDELLARVDVVDVVNARVTLKKTGRDYMACCPFHDEKTPSFSVSQAKQFYHCFGCGANGNAIGFLMEYENLHFVDAVEALAESVGLEVPRDEEAARRRDESRPLYELLEKVTLFYQRSLRDNPQAIDYLKRRGLSGETARRFAIGYAPDGWDALQSALPGEEERLLATGMLIPGKDGGRPYQRFRDRVMFPITDRRGRVIAFGGRVLGDAEPKYLNSPETSLFHKGRELYGLHEARRAAQEENALLVVEGYMDVVALAHHGVANAVATLGTATGREHVEMIFRTVPNVVFCFDGDRAGRAAAARALAATLPSLSDGRDAHFLFLPEGEDPDSLVRARGAEGFRALLAETRVPIVDFLYRHLADEIDDPTSIGGKARLAERAKPMLATLPRGLYRRLAVQRLEELIGLALDEPRLAEAARSEHRPSRPVARPARADTDLTRAQMTLAVRLILHFPKAVGELPPEDYEFDETIPGADVLSRIIGYCFGDPDVTTGRLLERFRDTPYFERLSALASEPPLMEGLPMEGVDVVMQLRDCTRLLRRSRERGQRLVGTEGISRPGLISIYRNRGAGS